MISLTCNRRSHLLDQTDVAIVVDARGVSQDESEWPVRTGLYAVARALTLEVAGNLSAGELDRRRAKWSSGRFGIRYAEA